MTCMMCGPSNGGESVGNNKFGVAVNIKAHGKVHDFGLLAFLWRGAV